MKRRSFLGLLGATAAAAAVGVVPNSPKKEEVIPAPPADGEPFDRALASDNSLRIAEALQRMLNKRYGELLTILVFPVLESRVDHYQRRLRMTVYRNDASVLDCSRHVISLDPPGIAIDDGGGRVTVVPLKGQARAHQIVRMTKYQLIRAVEYHAHGDREFFRRVLSPRVLT